MEGDTIMLQELFTFHREGKDAEGNIIGRYRLDRHPPALRRPARSTAAARSIRQALGYLPK